MKKVTFTHELIEGGLQLGARWPAQSVLEGLSSGDRLVFARLTERRDLELFFGLESEATDATQLLNFFQLLEVRDRDLVLSEAAPCRITIQREFGS